MAEPLITSVADTARWIAAYRAMESARPDKLFDDPLAKRLAGAKGLAIIKTNIAPIGTRDGWPIVMRTKLIDDLVLASISDGCDRVLCLAAGMDARPYRLDVPDTLDWIEVDLPAMITEKEQLLADERPRCRLTRRAVDLSDRRARVELLDEVTAGSAKALVLTEGLLLYLDESEVRELSTDLRRNEIGWWITDLLSPTIVNGFMRRSRTHLVNAPMKFGPRNGVAWFEDLGWRAVDVKSQLAEAAACNRLPRMVRPLTRVLEADPRNLGRAMWGGIVRLAA